MAIQQPRQAYIQCISPSGLHRVAYTEWGDPSNPRILVCVHGLTRCGRDFDVFAQAMSDVYRVICPDVVGRGLSEWLQNPAGYAVPQYVSDMVTLVARSGASQVDWFGTSMGGLIGMALGGLPGTPIQKMLLNDVGPRLEVPALERIAAYLGQPLRFASLEAGLEYLGAISASFGPHTPEEWRALNLPLFRQDGDGYVLRYDPHIAEPFSAVTPQVTMAGELALWSAFEVFEGPVLVVRGAESDLLSRETVAEMKMRGRRVASVEIPGVGHAPTFIHADQIALARDFFLS